MGSDDSSITLGFLPVSEGTGNARTLVSAIYSRMRAGILSCDYQPGEKLFVGPLSQRFGVSIASVREALFRLVADGLVHAEDQRGFRVSPLSLADLWDVTRTRIELECLALRRSIVRGDAAWQSALERAWEALCRSPHTTAEDASRHHETWPVMHGRFHTALVSACGLDWLLRFRATLYEQSERYRRLGLAVTHKSRDTHDEHLRLFEATRRRDGEEAAALLAQHFERTANAIAEGYLERAGTLLVKTPAMKPRERGTP
jgi:DNA-binding GntR family transcriptional regulator